MEIDLFFGTLFATLSVLFCFWIWFSSPAPALCPVQSQYMVAVVAGDCFRFWYAQNRGPPAENQKVRSFGYALFALGALWIGAGMTTNEDRFVRENILFWLGASVTVIYILISTVVVARAFILRSVVDHAPETSKPLTFPWQWSSPGSAGAKAPAAAPSSGASAYSFMLFAFMCLFHLYYCVEEIEKKNTDNFFIYAFSVGYYGQRRAWDLRNAWLVCLCLNILFWLWWQQGPNGFVLLLFLAGGWVSRNETSAPVKGPPQG